MKYLLSLLLFISLCCNVSGAVIHWFTDETQTHTLNASDVFIIQTVGPNQYAYITWEDLQDLLATPTTLSVSITNSVGTTEVGSTVNSTGLGWSISGTPVTQSINQGIGALAIGLRGYTHVDTYTTARTYTITVNSASATKTASTSVLFQHKRYWGPSDQTTLNDAQVLALSSEFGTSKTVSTAKSVTCAAQYMYFAYPNSWGSATFIVNGLLNTAWTLTTRNFVNSSGYTESYNIYRSDNLLTGTYLVTIQ